MMQPPVQPMHAARRTRPCMNAETASMTVQEGDSAGVRFETTGCSATFSLAISSADCYLRFRFSATSSVTHTHCADPSPTKHQHPSDQTRIRQGGGSVRLLRSLLRAAWLCCESNRNKPMATSTTWRAGQSVPPGAMEGPRAGRRTYAMVSFPTNAKTPHACAAQVDVHSAA